MRFVILVLSIAFAVVASPNAMPPVQVQLSQQTQGPTSLVSFTI